VNGASPLTPAGRQDGLAVEVRDLSFRYPDGTPALDQVSLQVARGERLALVGPNGAGKSTLLLHLNGLLQGRGLVRICGLTVEKRNLRAVRQKVGLVFQNPEDQLFCPTRRAEVSFGPRNLGLAEDEVGARVRRSMGLVGLAGCEDRLTHRLSWGEKKRAALAAVLALGAEILVVDEPAAFLDGRGRRELIALLKDLGGTQIIATHDLALVEALCERVLVLSRGRIVAERTPRELCRDAALLEAHGLA